MTDLRENCLFVQKTVISAHFPYAKELILYYIHILDNSCNKRAESNLFFNFMLYSHAVLKLYP
jgi:hypothetical protein